MCRSHIQIDSVCFTPLRFDVLETSSKRCRGSIKHVFDILETSSYRVISGYRVLSGFIGFYRVLSGFIGLSGCIGFYRVIRLYRVIGFYRVIEFYRVIMFYRVIRFYRDIGFYRVTLYVCYYCIHSSHKLCCISPRAASARAAGMSKDITSVDMSTLQPCRSQFARFRDVGLSADP